MQKEFLDEFFRRDNKFFLTGGAALAGFYLGHRDTADIDLFTLADEMETGARLLTDAASAIGASVENLQTWPDFRRVLVRRYDESIVVDLVREYVFQVEKEKQVINGIRIDAPDEILANKLCALLSRSELRDLVDVRQLELAGIDIEAALKNAAKKDTGFSPGQLAWILNQIEFGAELVPPGNVSGTELRDYRDGLVSRLSKVAFPE